MSYDVAVIGAGIIGLLTAFEFAQAGCQVAIIDAKPFGTQGSWAAAGICMPYIPNQIAQGLTRLVQQARHDYANICSHLEQATGIDPEYIQSGLLRLSVGDIDVSLRQAKAAGVQAVKCQSEHMRRLLPGLEAPVNQAIWYPDAHQLRSPRLLAALKYYLEQHANVQCMASCGVRRLLLKGSVVYGIETEQGDIFARETIICAGAWSCALLPEDVGLRTIKPLLGQMIAIQAAPNLFKPILQYDGRYILSRRDGLILIGSTLEDTGFEQVTTAHARLQLTRFAYQLLPMLKNHPVVHQWSGLRAVAPRPIIARLPFYEGLGLVSGHSRDGIATAPASARLIREIILGQSPCIDPKYFAANVNDAA